MRVRYIGMLPEVTVELNSNPKTLFHVRLGTVLEVKDSDWLSMRESGNWQCLDKRVVDREKEEYEKNLIRPTDDRLKWWMEKERKSQKEIERLKKLIKNMRLKAKKLKQIEESGFKGVN